MFNRSPIHLAGLGLLLFVCSNSGSAQTLTLTYQAVTAEYSNALDRIILISASPNQLHVFDPSTNTDTQVILAKPPLSLSVSPDGLHAAVGHDALISYVNLQTLVIEKTLAVATTVTNLALGNDFVYVMTYSGGTESIQISTGTVSTFGVYEGTAGRLHPSGKALYTTGDGFSPDIMQELDVSTGPVTAGSYGPYWGDYPVCGGIWFSPDGRRTYTGCASAYQASPEDPTNWLLDGSTKPLDTNADGLYVGRLPDLSQINSLASSASLNRVAAIPTQSIYGPPSVLDNQVHIYDSTYLELTGIFQLPDFVVTGKSYQAHGHQVFYNFAGTVMYVVMQADGSSGLLNSYAVQVFSLTVPPVCSPAFNAPSVTLAASGTVATVGITAPATCIYQASTTNDWIQLISGAYGSGNGTLTYIVRPNTGTSRSGAINLGGQVFSITQPAPTSPSSLLNQLGYSVAGADYSRSLDKLVMIVSTPKELHIYDPVSGAEQIVQLPKTPLCVSVSPDGLSAAVGFDGWVSTVDLSTATVSSTVQVFTDAHTIMMAGNGYVYTYPQNTWGDLFSVQIGSGVINIAGAIYSGRYPRLYYDGSAFYTEGSKWNILAGPAVPITGTSGAGCGAPFWLTEDGTRMIGPCAKVYTTSPVPSLDLQYSGSFSNATSIQWADESPGIRSTVLIPSVSFGSTTTDTYVQVYGDLYLSYAGELPLPQFTAGSHSYAGHGRYTFWNSRGDRLTVLEQADSSASLTADYGVTVFSMTTPAAGCTFTLGATSATAGASGGLNSVDMTAGVGCVWQAISNASWITVDSGAVGFGSGSVNYEVAPSLGGSRSGTITIAGQTFTVNQTADATITISGQAMAWVCAGGGVCPLQPLSGVTVTISGSQTGSTKTIGTGTYSFTVPAGGTYTVSASLQGYYFYPYPAALTFNSASANQTANFQAAVQNDFNHDGHADVIWEEPKIGWAQVWYLNCSPSVSCYPPLGSQNVTQANPWNIIGVGDFKGDGTPDVVWQDPVSGAVQVWYLGGSGGVTLQSAINITTKNPWKVVSVADFNHDGHPDLLWQDPVSGWAQIWYLGGAQGVTLLAAANITTRNPWHVVGAADFNNDGYVDVLWQDPVSGTVQLWYMTGSTPGQEGTQLLSATNITGGMTTKVVAVGDFNSDGQPDLIFQDPVTGAATVYFYTGTQGITPGGTSVLSSGNPWYIAGPR